jgi:hypothetical protein
MIKYERNKTFLDVLHFPGLAINLIFVRKMSDAGVHNICEKDSCKMVKGVAVLMRGVQIGNLYKFLGSFNSTSCNNTIVPEVEST